MRFSWVWVDIWLLQYIKMWKLSMDWLLYVYVYAISDEYVCRNNCNGTVQVWIMCFLPIGNKTISCIAIHGAYV